MVGTSQSPLNRLQLFKENEAVINETVELLQLMIQTNTTNPPGNEIVLAQKIDEILQNLACPYLNSKIIETYPTRGNLIITIQGSQASEHPIWGFHGHLDVVQAEGEWKYPPFSGALVELEHDKFIWGRGALDMKKQCTAHLMALIILLREGWKPKGTVKLIYTADEEAGGRNGAEVLVEKYFHEVKVDCMIEEAGGEKAPTGQDFFIQRGEKGKAQMKLLITGVSGHGSMPRHLERYAIYKLLRILEKIRKYNPPLLVNSYYTQMINAMSMPTIAKFLLKRKYLIRPLINLISIFLKVDIGKFFFSLLTNTIAPTIIRAGEKVNVISPDATLSLDIRTLPGCDQGFILNTLNKILGSKLWSDISIQSIDTVEATISPINTSFYEQISSTMKSIYPKANLVPIIGLGGTDSKFWRKKGIPCYGFSPMLIDEDLSYDELMGMAHAPDERISITNLMLATEFAYLLMKQL